MIGVDASAAAIAKARALLPRDALPQIRFVHADVNEVSAGQLGVRDVDLAYCRLMLLHQADPARTVQRIASFVRAEGVVIAHEASDSPAHAPASEPHVPAMTRVWELVIAAARARGAQTDFARNGRTYFERAGLTAEASGTYAAHYPPAIGYDIPRVALHSLRPTLALHALAGDDEIAQLDHALEAAKHADGVQWVTGPLMFEWIGRKR
ncbi:MAG TPA: methyltransferase domain-containing protein [Thermoanaerobaculia bacterium]